VTGGKRFITALSQLAKKELHTWRVQRNSPLTLVHSQRPGIRATFAVAGTAEFKRAVSGYRILPQPAALATVTKDSTGDQVLVFLLGMLARRAGTLGVATVIIPLADKA